MAQMQRSAKRRCAKMLAADSGRTTKLPFAIVFPDSRESQRQSVQWIFFLSSVQEKTHYTKPAVFQELVGAVVLLALSHSLLCFLSCVSVHDLAIAPWQVYWERKVKTTASLSRMGLIGD